MSQDSLTQNPNSAEISNPVRTVEYPGGRIDYELIGNSVESEHNPIVVIPGYGRGMVGYRELGKGLSQDGERTTVVVDQPHWSAKEQVKFGKLGGLSALDHQAEALLAVIKDINLQNRPVDFVAHSFGAVILERAAELAHERGLDMTPFDSEKGSHSIFVAPAGTIEGEKVMKLIGRFGASKKQSAANNRRGNDQYKEVNDEGKRYTKYTPKTIREAVILGKTAISYKDLGTYGLKPFILGFPEDRVSVHGLMAPTLEQNAEHVSGYSMPLSPEGTHDEVVFAPQTTINSILAIIDGK
jgi:hypothetical protein